MSNLLIRGLIFSLAIIGIASCNVEIVGIRSGYDKLDEVEKSRIEFVSNQTPICKLQNDGKIYSITATQLKKCLFENDASLVYIWDPNCGSKICLSLGVVENYCKNNKLKLFIISEYYDFESIEIQNGIDSPIFSINHNYYHTDFCGKYNRLFLEELFGENKISSEHKYKRYLFFNGGELSDSRSALN